MDFGVEESIYDIIPPQGISAAKEHMYRSKHNPKRPPSYSTFGVAGSARTVANASGTEDVQLNARSSSTKRTPVNADPNKFLKKGASQQQGSNTAAAASQQPFHREEAKKPPVPAREDKPIMGLKTEKNFVVSNAVECILSVPKKKPVQQTTSLAKATYGTVPKYIEKAKEELHRQYEDNAASTKDSLIPKEDKLHKMSDSEVEALLSGLKRRWEEVNKAFQTMSFSMETSTQLHRKDQLEKEMKVLDDAMKRLNKRFLFVYEDA
eukprot:PhF_6_TR31122/c0_g1_i1/m.45554